MLYKYLTQIGRYLAILGLIAAEWILVDSSIARSVNNNLFDKFSPSTNPHKSIVIVEIGEKSLESLGQWPWSRETHAELIDRIAEGNPHVIAFDIFFPETTTEDVLLLESVSRNTETNFVFASKLISDNQTGLSESQPVLNSEGKPSNLTTGFGNVPQDEDGKVRDYTFQTKAEDGLMNSLGASILKRYFGEEIAQNGLKNTEIPFDNKYRYPITFTESPGQFVHFEYIDVLERRIPPEEFENKIVLTGVVVQDLKHGIDDNFVSPKDGQYIPGVYIHANATNTVLKKAFITETPKTTRFLISIALIIIIFAFTEILSGNYRTIPLVLVPAYAFNTLALAQAGIRTEFFAVVVGGITAWGISFITRYSLEYFESRKLRAAFSQYVNPHIINRILNNGKIGIEPGGEVKDLTVMFSDIVGFTSLSEGMAPENLINFINRYLSAASEIILKNDGVIDKYLGDEIMAFWGSPIPDAKPATKACTTATELIRNLREFNAIAEESTDKKTQLKIGIGIHHGEMIVGNLGSIQKFDYTVIGDNVNVASRVQSITRKYGVAILTTGEVISKLESEGSLDTFVYRQIDNVKLKGKKKPIKLYEIQDLGNRAPSEILELNAKFKKAYADYENGRFQSSSKTLKTLAKNGDPASAILESRIKDIQLKKQNFDGIWTWDEK